MTLDDAKAMLARHNARSAVDLRCACGRWYYDLPISETLAVQALVEDNPGIGLDKARRAVFLLKQMSTGHAPMGATLE